MRTQRNNFAFIDSQNLNLSIRQLGWILDYQRFRVYLREKYGVTKAFLFIGYVSGNQALYTALQSAGFICVFKPTLVYSDGSIKGNCDAELVLQAMIELSNYDRAVVVTGDGDFHCLVKHLVTIGKFEKLLIPNQKKYSALLRRFPSQYLAFVSDLEHSLKRRP